MNESWKDQEIIRLKKIIHEHRERDRKVEILLGIVREQVDSLKKSLSSKIK